MLYGFETCQHAVTVAQAGSLLSDVRFAFNVDELNTARRVFNKMRIDAVEKRTSGSTQSLTPPTSTQRGP